MFYARINKIKVFNNREEHYPHGTRDKQDGYDREYQGGLYGVWV
jgi:hypothetical protein